MAKPEIHNGIVTRNIQADNASTLLLRGSVFFEAPTLFKGEYPLPAEPCFPFASSPNGAGFFVVPKVGDEIEIIVLVDDPNEPYDSSDAELPEPRWRCMVYSDAADIAEEFKKNYPFRMGWKSNSGHFLVFDDFSGEELVQLFHKIGTQFTWDFEGNWLEDVKKDKTVKIVGIRDTDVGGNEIKTIGGDEDHDTTGDRTHTAANHNVVTAGDIKLGSLGSAENLVLGLAFKTLYNAHMHIGNLGAPTGAPLVPLGASELASRQFTEIG